MGYDRTKQKSFVFFCSLSLLQCYHWMCKNRQSYNNKQELIVKSPVTVWICGFVLQKNYLTWVMATHFPIGIMDDTVLIIPGN